MLSFNKLKTWCIQCFYFIDTSDPLLSLTHPFYPSLPLVLISHFLLDLQESYQQNCICLIGSDDWLHTSRSIGSPGHRGFTPALGALGAAIEFGDPDLDLLDSDDEIAAFPLSSQATGRIHSASAEDGPGHGPFNPEFGNRSSTLHNEPAWHDVVGSELLQVDEEGRVATPI